MPSFCCSYVHDQPAKLAKTNGDNDLGMRPFGTDLCKGGNITIMCNHKPEDPDNLLLGWRFYEKISATNMLLEP